MIPNHFPRTKSSPTISTRQGDLLQRPPSQRLIKLNTIQIPPKKTRQIIITIRSNSCKGKVINCKSCPFKIFYY